MSDKRNIETKSERKNAGKLAEDVDYYFDDGFMVLTSHFLLRRGYCCGNGCRHCPYQKTETESQKESI